MAFDPYLYLAFGIGLAAGWVVRPKSPWVPRLTVAAIVVLVGLLGASLTSIGGAALLATVPLALGFAALMLAATLAVVLLLARLRPYAGPPPRPGTGSERFPLSGLLLLALVGGYLVGRVTPIPAEAAIPWALCALLGIVGFGLELRVGRLPDLWRPLTAAAVGAILAAGVVAALARVPVPVALATASAFGFYSLAGPLVAARAGAELGLLAFLTNFLREDLTMLSAPWLGRRARGEGLTAMGGATAMDTTLYFVTRYGDREAASVAIATGLLLTVAATLVVPALLALPV